MRKIASGVLVLWVLGNCSGDHEYVESDNPCVQLREHMIDLRLADATGIDPAAHREALRAAMGEVFLERCSTSMTEARLACALEAGDTAALNACPGGE